MQRSLVVKLTCGADATADLERTAQALTVCATAAAGGIPVRLWLTGGATYLATPGYAERLTLAHSAPLADLRDAMLALDAITVCTQCAARRDLTPDDLLPGASIAGAMGFVEQVMTDGTQALVY